MNVKLTDLDICYQTPGATSSIPEIIHFLPGCDDYLESWKELNPEFLMISWDTPSLERMRKNSIASHLPLDVKYDLIVSSALCYHYGGIVISKPEKCYVSLRNLLGFLPNTLLAVFALGGSTLLDSSIIISSAKISAFSSLMEYFLQAQKQSKSLPVVLRDFVKSSMDASNEGAIVCLHSNVKDKLTRAPKIKYNKDLMSLESMLPSSVFFKIINPSTLSSEIIPWLTAMNKKETDSPTEKIGILVIDNETFNKEAPVPQAIAAVIAFQDIVLCDDAIVIVAHSPPGGIGLDMMLIPQLTMMNGKEIYRTSHVAWKLAKS